MNPENPPIPTPVKWEAVKPPTPLPVAVPIPLKEPSEGSQATLEPRSFRDLDLLADTLMRGGLANGKTAPAVKCAILASIALKIPPIIGIQELYVTPQGKWEAETRLLLALAQRSPDWGGYEVAFSGSVAEGTRACKVTMKRKGCPDQTQDMDMERAKSWGWLTPKIGSRSGKDENTWNKDTDHMLEQRATSWAVRKQFSAETLGLYGHGEITE